MTNPDAVTGMLKQSLGGIVPQVAMGAFVSFFFSGFILGKVPFPLSPSFRLMLQASTGRRVGWGRVGWGAL